jgi:succinyl-diaminopimelate desuccinylase
MTIVDILQSLVKCKSISPIDDGAIDYCESFLMALGFKTQKLLFGDTANLYAKFDQDQSKENLCFAGHVDVVPPLSGWSVDPFSLTIKNGKAFGRGTNDMKGPLAACLLAVHDLVLSKSIPNNRSVSFILTSDEEIMGGNGTKKVVESLKAASEKVDYCILCESSSPTGCGEYIKIGCRGSLNVELISEGQQRHVATTSNKNHIHDLVGVLNNLASTKLDQGTKLFPPSSLQITSVDVGNDVRNIVPTTASAKLNIRFNDAWTKESLIEHIEKNTPNMKVIFETFDEAFISAQQNFIDSLCVIIKNTTKKQVQVGTNGGNSDAIFLRELAQTVEIGSPLVNAHILDEFILLNDLNILYNIYKNILLNSFA